MRVGKLTYDEMRRSQVRYGAPPECRNCPAKGRQKVPVLFVQALAHERILEDEQREGDEPLR